MGRNCVARGVPLLALVLALVWCVALAAPTRADALGRRVALVVGNNAYQNVTRLANPGNDAKLMAATLKAAGFVLVGGGAQVDLNKVHFDAAVAAFGRAIEGADVALFYYSGHGMQVSGTNYLVPVDANPERMQDLDFQMVSADVVLRQFSGGGAKLNLLILDACRNNPFGGRGLRGAGGGLAEMHAPEGTLISYATQPGNVASDGSGHDSPYTIALADAIRTPGLDLLRLFNHVGLAVKKATGGEQQPWLASSPLEGDFYFMPPTAQPAVQAAAPAPVASAADAPAAEVRTSAAPAAHVPAQVPAQVPAPGAGMPPKQTAMVQPPSTPAPAPVSAGAGYHCPRAGLVTVANGVRELWRGADPASPNLCVSVENGKQTARLFAWHDMWNPELLTAEAPLQRFFAGEVNEVDYTVANYTFAWTRMGQDALTVGGRSIAVQKLDLAVTQMHNSWIGSKIIQKVQHRGVWHFWYDPQTGLYLKGHYDALVGERSFETEDWEVTSISG